MSKQPKPQQRIILEQLPADIFMGEIAPNSDVAEALEQGYAVSHVAQCACTVLDTTGTQVSTIYLTFVLDLVEGFEAVAGTDGESSEAVNSTSTEVPSPRAYFVGNTRRNRRNRW